MRPRVGMMVQKSFSSGQKDIPVVFALGRASEGGQRVQIGEATFDQRQELAGVFG